MKIYYKNDLKKSFLIIEGEESDEGDFQNKMLEENEIPGVLVTSIKYIDNKIHYYYDISGKVSLHSIYEKEKMSKDHIKSLVDAVLQVMKEVPKYMLDGHGILLEPEYIFMEKEQYYFCYFPQNELEITKEFHHLTEFFVREVDYKDKEGVHLAYTLHKETMEEHYSIEKIMENALEGEPIEIVTYEQKMEEQTSVNIKIAEKKEMWEPVKRLLEKTKRERWGRWEGL